MVFLIWYTTIDKALSKINYNHPLIHTVSCTNRKIRVCENHVKHTPRFHVKEDQMVKNGFSLT